VNRSEWCLIVHLLNRAAEEWALGDVDRATVWTTRAWAVVGSGEFLDLERRYAER
jgi:hypothetical protein